MKKEHKRRKKGKMVVFVVLIVVILAAVAIVVSRNAKMSGIWLWKKDRKFWIEYAGVVTVGIDASLVNMEAQDNMRKEAEKDTVLLASAQQRAQKLLDDYVNNIGACTGKTYTIKWIYLDGAKELQEAESE